VFFIKPLLLYQEENELRLVPGDELRLRYLGDGIHSGWQSVGHVVRSCEHSGHALYIHGYVCLLLMGTFSDFLDVTVFCQFDD
jgi:hypothetical protein